MNPPQALVIHAADNVAVALHDLKKGEMLNLPDGRSLTLASDIPFGHKVALADIGAGAEITKYGESIGQASAPIARGEWVHTHNLNIMEKQ